jgi:tRNA threonylcarbamoyl adenosine modification protein YeaZ/ribosomal-protein-alanine acetyltransferase
VITLAIDASTYEGDVALLDDGRVVAEQSAAMKGRESEQLMPAVAEVLKQAAVNLGVVERVVCGAGPGSFTSLRIAGGIAKGIASGLCLPLFAAPSLALIVAGAEPRPGRYLGALDALRGEFYVALYDVDDHGGIVEVEPARIVPATEVGAVAGEYRARIVSPTEFADGARSRPRTSGVTRLEGLLATRGPVDVRTVGRGTGAMGIGARAAAAARMSVSIDTANLADVPAIMAIERAVFSDPWSARSFREAMSNPLVFCACARRDGRAVEGYVVAWFVADEGEIANLAVAPDAWGTGIGRALLDASIEAARARKLKAVYLEVRDSNAPARHLYGSRGFVEIGRRRSYYRRPVEDAIVLRRSMGGDGR